MRMTKVELLNALKERMEVDTGNMLFPVRPQKAGEDAVLKHAEVYCQRLPDTTQPTKKAPYIINSVVNSKHAQSPGEDAATSVTVVRTTFCVYCDDEQEGSLMLLNLMECIRISLLKNPILRKQFLCLLDDTDGGGIEDLVYPDNLHPYYIGEMITVWDMPRVKREVPCLWQ